MTTVFFGTPSFAATVLQSLLDAGQAPDLVVTATDKPAGRGRATKPSEVRVLAQEAGLRLLVTDDVNSPEALEELAALEPEIGITAAFGQILSNQVLSLFSIGAFNVHGSLLPDYRGASPIQWALLDGAGETGVTTFLMNQGIDLGEILLQGSCAIDPDDDYLSLHDKLALIGGDLAVRTLQGLREGSIKPTPQSRRGKYCRRFTKSDGLLDFTLPAEKLVNRIRALTPWPGTYTFFRGKKLAVLKATLARGEELPQAAPGQVALLDKGRELALGTGQGLLILHRVKLEGKSEVAASQFISGYRPEDGEILG